MLKESAEGLGEAHRLVPTLHFRRVCTAVWGTQVALHSLPVAGHLLLSAGIPSESAVACFMQSDSVTLTELTTVLFSM